MFVNTNMAAINAQRNLNVSAGGLARSVEKLSSGLRINRAADDAAGLTISEKLRGQVKGLNQAVRNAQDGISMIQTAEGALNETHSILQRMRELAVQASNDTLMDTDRGAIASELTALRDEVDRISDTTQFNSKTLLGGSLQTKVGAASAVKDGVAVGNGTAAIISKVDVSGAAAHTFTFASSGTGDLTLTDGTTGVSQTVTVGDQDTAASQVLDFSKLGVKVTLAGTDATNLGVDMADGLDTLAITTTGGGASLHIGANKDQNITLSVASAHSSAVGTTATAGFLTLTAAVDTFSGAATAGNAEKLIANLDNALSDVSGMRSGLGAVQNRLEHTISNLSVASENLTASESRIRDADMASEMVGFTKNQILQQAGTAILAQANQIPQGVLSLLR